MTPTVRFLSSLAAVAAALVVSFSAPPAEARIVCREGMQLVQGQYLATPYCQDALVAEIARQNGFKVSDHEIRWNYGRKMEICRVIGRNNRISSACIDAFQQGRGPRG